MWSVVAMRSLRGAPALAIALLIGCASVPDEVARHELSLRDVLVATPEAVRELPLEERLSLARRLADAMDEQRERAIVDARASIVPEVVDGFDEAREARGEEALIVVALEAIDLTVEVRTIEQDAPDGGTAATEPSALRIEDESLRLEVESAGPRARAWIDRLARDRGASELVAAPSMPAGLAGDAERIHVNPVWLELLALLDAGGDLGRSSAALIDGPDRGPVLEHHTGSSTGYGCYRSMSASCSLGICGSASSCSCGTCGFDCGPCAAECGDESDGIHCSSAGRRPPEGSPIDPLWLVAPVAYLAWRRRRA